MYSLSTRWHCINRSGIWAGSTTEKASEDEVVMGREVHRGYDNLTWMYSVFYYKNRIIAVFDNLGGGFYCETLPGRSKRIVEALQAVRNSLEIRGYGDFIKEPAYGDGNYVQDVARLCLDCASRRVAVASVKEFAGAEEPIETEEVTDIAA